MAWSAWTDLEGSYLADLIRTGDAGESPIQEMHARLVRLGEAFKYGPCPVEDVDTFFAEPLVRWGLERASWVSDDMSGGDILYEGMNDVFPRSTLIEWAQRAMAAVLTMARETSTYYTGADPYSETRPIARNEDWSDYTGAGSDTVAYPWEFEPATGTPYSGYDWTRSDRPDGMGECALWIEKIRAVLDDLKYFAIPFDEVRLVATDPAEVIEVGAGEYTVAYRLGSGVNSAAERSRAEEDVELDEITTQEQTDWDAWRPAHEGRGTTWLLDDLTWAENGDLPSGTTAIEDGGWNWAAAGTHQEWVEDEEPVASDQVQIVDVEYTPAGAGGEMLATWGQQLRGDKYYHYGSETFGGPNSYLVTVDPHIGDVVDEADLAADTYIKTWAEQDLEATLTQIQSRVLAGGESAAAWWAKNWVFMDVPVSGFSVTWTSGFLVGVGFYRKLELDFTTFLTAELGSSSAFKNIKVTYTLRTFDNVTWTWLEAHSQQMAGNGAAPFTLATYDDAAASILRDRRSPGTDLIPVTVEAEPPYVDVWRYGGHHLQDGVRLGKRIHTARPLDSFSVDHAEIVGAGALEVCRNQRIAVLNGDVTDLDSGDLADLAGKNPGRLGLNWALLSESRFADIGTSPLSYLTDEGTQLDRALVSDFGMGSETWGVAKVETTIPLIYFIVPAISDAFAVVLLAEVLAAYDAGHHYHEADSGSAEPWRVSVLPELAYRPTGTDPLYQINAYIEVTHD